MAFVSIQSSDTTNRKVIHQHRPVLEKSSQHSESEQARLLSLSQSSSSNESPRSEEIEENPKQEADVVQDGDRVKTKLISMWNNVRYSWNFKTKTHFAKDSPIWLLGRIYHSSLKSDDSSSLPSNNFESLKSDFTSRIWLILYNYVPC